MQVILIILLIIAIGSTIFFTFNKPPEIEEQQNETLPEAGNQTNETVQVPPPEENQTFSDDPFSSTDKPHWTHLPLTYKIKDENNCGSALGKLQESIQVISSSTNSIITFAESSALDADIEINCIDGEAVLNTLNESVLCKEEIYDYDKTRIDPKRENLINASDFFINVTKFEKVTIINTTTNETSSEFIFTICYLPKDKVPNSFKEPQPTIIQNLIIHSSINVYKPGNIWNACAAFSARETHSLLHALGIAHSDEPKYDDYYGWADTEALKDIMFADLICKHQTSLNEKYASCLKKIYSNNEAEGSCDGVNFYPSI